MITQIAGILALGGGEPSEAGIEAMLDAMNPRGLPAARATARAGQALFGAIGISGSGAAPGPPILGRDEGGLFAADLRLWDPEGTGPGAASDPVRAVAALTRREGGAAAARLHGDFAWARWDGRALELVRDHFGARPLYYTVRPGQFAAFASHPGALLAAGLAGPALDLRSLLSLAADNSPRPGRFYQADIATQPPAHLTRITPAGGVTTWRYWRLPIGPRLSERTDPAEVSAELRRLLEQAVRRRLPASGPAGGHLSGGLDSSALAVIAARAIRDAGRRFIGYSFEESGAGLDFEPVDELSYVAEIAAAEPNIEHVPVPEPSFVAPLIGRYDTTLFEPAGEPEHKILKHAEAAGLDTLLSGWGGDQVVSYNASFALAELFLHGRWGMLRAELRHYRSPAHVVLYHEVLLPLLPAPLRLALSRLTGRALPEVPALPSFCPPALRRLLTQARRPPPGLSFRARREMAERNFIQHRLARFAHLGAAYGVRYVYPLLDLDLVHFAMRVPAYFLVRRGTSRCLMRDAVRGLLPERVRLREVKLFPHSLDTLRLARLRERIDARLAAIPADGLASRAVDLPALRAAYQAAIDSPEATLARMREHAARGEQLFHEAFRYSAALQLAVALDEYERQYGRVELR